MARFIDVQIGNARGRIRLLDEEAPRTAQAIWDLLPIEDRTVPVRWSGNAWRTDRDYPIPPDGIENRPDFLEAGDLAYYPRLQKICFAYGKAQWRAPSGQVRDISLVGRVEEGLDDLVAASDRAHTEGSVVCRFARHESRG